MRYHHVAFLSLLLVGCYVPGRGFVESEFELVLKDRLPRFFHAPENAQASEYSARVTCYSGSSGYTERVVIRDRSGRVVFDETCPLQWHPLSNGRHAAGHYPSYTVVSFDSGTDIFEQRALEPKLYLCDDKQVWDMLPKAPNQSSEPTPQSGEAHLWRSAKEYFVIAVLPSPSLPIPFTRLVK